jgi:pimeloyl-ACP methyl ester carboxylesterase
MQALTIDWNYPATRSAARIAGRAVLLLFSIVLAGVLGLVGVLLYWSYPGKPKPFVDEEGRPLVGSISEKVRVAINGVQQGMFVESKDATRPVLLYLHGGLPEHFLTRRYPTGFEDLFTVVWWEQRGSGLSYSAAIPPETMTLEQLISDTVAVTDYLRRRFGQEKIYLMAHSGGTFIGIQAAARAPERYHAYIGVAQSANQLRSETLAYDYMLQRFRDGGDAAMARKLESAPVTTTGGTPAAYLAVRDEGMHRLGIGTMRGMTDVMKGLFLESLRCREYSLGEKVNLWRGKLSAGVSILWDEMITTDLSQTLPRVDLPVYFLHGIYDYTCSYAVAREYFEGLRAPVKGFYTFERSAHSPTFEEPERTLRILREDVLAGANALADATREVSATVRGGLHHHEDHIA